MGKNIFAAKHFHDEEAARAWFEAARWSGAPNCPKCGSLDPYTTKKPGVYRCRARECRKDFTVMTGTVMERSHAKLTQWAMAFWLGASSKKGFSAHQLHRALGCQYNTAWFLHHRVMEAMRMGGLDLPPMSGPEGIVETDETYFGPVKDPSETRRDGRPYKIKSKRARTKYAGPANKRAIVTLIERHGKVRSFHVPRADKATVLKIVTDNISHEARLHTGIKISQTLPLVNALLIHLPKKGRIVKRITSPRMTPELAAQIKALLAKGLQQHQVAAMLKINQGRISEVSTGKIFAQTKPSTQVGFNFD